MFKIIGIRIHEGCEPNIRKVLKEEKSYFIYNNYEDDYSNDQYSIGSKWVGIKHRNDATEIIPPDDFYNLKDNKKGPNISVSAIVGKNGSGKSSLIEIAIRIINNFAIEAGFIENQSSLIRVKGLKATLFYSIDKNIYYIKCDGEIITWRKGKTTIDIHDKNAKRKLLSHSKDVFYTIITNYSMFAYNSLNFQNENEDMDIQEDGESWITPLFHRNDSYQIPVVLNPKRTKGNFDVNQEKEVITQRLLALHTDAGNEELFMSQNALGYVFSLEEKSKLYTVSIELFFKSTLGKKVVEHKPYIFNSDSELSRLSFFLTSLSSMWYSVGKKIENNKELFNLANNKILQPIFGQSTETDLVLYLDDLTKDIKNRDEFKDSCKRIESVKSILEQYPLINFLQLQRLLMIIDLWDCWKNKEMIDKDLSISDILESKDPRHQAMLYLVYQTISIFETYENRYYFNSTITENNPLLFDTYFFFSPESNRLTTDFYKLYEDLNKEMSYETLKLRQTINYLKYSRKQSILGTKVEQGICGYDYYLSFIQLLQHVKKIKKEDSSLKTIELLPPPIFVGDILYSVDSAFNTYQNLNSKKLKIVLNEKTDNVFTLKMKSSGEQQLLFSIATLIYHLRNLNFSTNQNGNITYSNVSIILDEVELYFHPEYQRKYVDYLLESIAHAGLDSIKNINICCITHSPFILSDIPKNNVLFLDNGNSVRTMQEDTFGANIHTILQNGFFLESLPIGEFAKKKINELFAELHKGKCDESTYNLIQLVSEPVLKSQLLKMYKQLPSRDDNRITKLTKEVESLKKEIEQLKKRQQ